MPSPFSPFENAIILFNIPTGRNTINSVGNRVAETTTVEIRAMLNPIKDAAQVSYYLGDDETSELMSGYLINPVQLPTNLHPPIDGKATITRSLGITQKGTFKILPRTQSPYLIGAKVNFLNKILGIFRYG